MSAYTYKKLTKKLEKIGFRFFRQGKGSHTLWVRDTDKRAVPVPNHGSRDIATGTVRAIAKEVGIKNIRELDNL